MNDPQLPKFRLSEISTLFDQVLPDLMHKYHVPGVGIVGIENGTLAWTRQFGVRSIQTQEAVTANTIFEACSMTKPLFAYAVLKLVEREYLDLDVPLVKYLGHPYIENEPLHEIITARMVLTHTSGLPNWRPGDRDGDEPLVVHFEPGSDYQYSGEGFWFLQRAVESITNTPLHKWLDAQLMQPLGMKNSSLVWKDEFDDVAVGHDINGQPEKERNPFTRPNAAFSLYTTPSDYALFIEEILKPDRAASHSLEKEMLMQMLASHYEAPHTKSYGKRTLRGLGWEILETANATYHGHAGANRDMFRCTCLFDVSARDGFVLMANAAGGEGLREELLSALY